MRAPLTAVRGLWREKGAEWDVQGGGEDAFSCSLSGDGRDERRRNGPAIITLHSTLNSGSSRGFLKKRLTSPIIGSALISSFVSSRSLGEGSSGRARTMNVSSALSQKNTR